MDDLSAINTCDAGASETQPTAWQDAILAAQILKAGGPRLGGLWLKARAGGVRDAYLSFLKSYLSADTPWARMPCSVTWSALLGSPDFTATAHQGRLMMQPGLLARADKGVLLLPMAERLEAGHAAVIGQAMDTGKVPTPSHAAAPNAIQTTRFMALAVDESAGPEEALPPILSDRLGLIVDLNAVPWHDVSFPPERPLELNTVPFHETFIETELAGFLAQVAETAGNTSLRSFQHLMTVSRLRAALDSRKRVTETDALDALRLCLALTLRMPETAEPPPPETRPDNPADTSDAPLPTASQPESAAGEPDTSEIINSEALLDMLAAVQAGTIAGLPDIANGHHKNPAGTRAGKSGALKKNARRGRPVATSRTPPYPDARPNVIATLRAAAPWQKIRKEKRALLAASASKDDQVRCAPPRTLIVRDDYRYQRLRHETPSTAIFVVDASGSTALERLGETKGAIEQLLARCYVRRDEVAMIAFRGKGADIVLEPTRSLVAAKRKLAGLPGGGATPLAAGLQRGVEMALNIRRQGSTPVLVLLTDGRGNIALNGEANRLQAAEELSGLAACCRQQDLKSICIDIARRPRDTVADLAESMGADHHFLRHADAYALSDVVNTSLEEARR
ncbi:VWA domain-containing protein [Roseibium denhamense]|uniref:Protoporphyrin IX magnesium-chelatase n=1 Tax=Roseibium denhamense TaxID=76305 RepID=A0ABY1PP68_9HYPH|nr:VWA domain-containing protein [Roseibium denhamense]MTI07053.1 VWA domain-containing protein [Roseibium denhamense]SMP36513.1 protoporphyrin IX magnesium-chelatase [Roseibium denhamense]